MKKILSFSIILSFLAINFQSQAQSLVYDTLMIDGISRDYILYAPAIYNANTAVPLVINMHGYGSNNAQQRVYGSFDSFADVDNFIVVTPNGTLDQTNTRYWNAFVNSGAVDDVSFISQLIDTIALSYNIDQTKIFATGMSNGGFMSYKLACELTNRISKIASVTGTLNTALELTCSPSSPISVMQIHGTNDATVPYQGNVAMLPIPDVIDYWVAHNNCDTTPNVTQVPNTSTTDNCTAERIEYTNGDNNTEVILYKVIDGGHTWPGAPLNLPGVNTNQDFRASQVIWEFFKGDEFVGIKDRIDSDQLSISIQGETLTAKLQGNSNIEALLIVNTLGQEVLSTKEASANIGGLNKGIYYVLVETNSGFISKAFSK